MVVKHETVYVTKNQTLLSWAVRLWTANAYNTQNAMRFWIQVQWNDQHAVGYIFYMIYGSCVDHNKYRYCLIALPLVKHL